MTSLVSADIVRSRHRVAQQQSVGVLVTSGVGAVGCLLPWGHAPIFGDITGTRLDTGLACLACFGLIALLALLHWTRRPSTTVIVVACLASLIATVFAWLQRDSIIGNMSSRVVPGVGLWVVIFSGIATLIAVAGFRSKAGADLLRAPATVPTDPTVAGWYVFVKGGEMVGPVSDDLVIRGIGAGRIPPEAQVGFSGGDEWVPIRAIPKFAAAFDARAQ